MCCIEREDGAIAVDEKYYADGIPYENCIALSVDNASTMVGVNNSVASSFKTKNRKIYKGECPFNLAQIAASHASNSFSDALGFIIEILCVHLFYWFDRSSKR